MSRHRHQRVPVHDSFVGREDELERVITLMLGRVRLLTLIGPGGIGKTRLAAEAVRGYRVAEQRPVHWVRLARLTAGSDAAVVEDEVAQAVVGSDFSTRTAGVALLETLIATPSVLVLDNCEHVLDGVGELISRLLDSIDDLSIVATSRTAIGWVDEYRITVAPLAHRDAVALFRQRSELTDHPVVDGDEADIGAICRHMNDHPLYIRLAAARLAHRPPAMILAELSGESGVDGRLDWGDGPRFGVDARHRAISDAITWSYDLCAPRERVLFERMSVFAAGYAIDPEEDGELRASVIGVEAAAIQAVCADEDTSTESHLTADEIEILLANLVDHSLVTVHVAGPTVRYSLVESLRVFAAHRLRERSTGSVDHAARVAQRYLHYYRDQVVYAAATWYSDAECGMVDWAVASWDNIRTAAERGMHTPDELTTGLQICACVLAMRLPFVMGSLRETRRLAEQALEATRTLQPPPNELRVTTQAWIALIALCQSDLEGAARLLDECVDTHFAGVPAADRPLHWRRTVDTDIGLPPAVEVAWGHELLALRDAKSVTVLERAVRKCEDLGDVGGAGFWGLASAMAAALLWTRHPALTRAQHYLDTDTGSVRAKSWAQLIQAIVKTKSDDPEGALVLERQALTGLLAERDQAAAIWTVHTRTWSLARLVEKLRAAERTVQPRVVALAIETAQLLGAASVWRTRLGIDISRTGPFHDETEHATAIVRDVLSAEQYSAATSQGAGLRPELNEIHLFAQGTLSVEPRYPVVAGADPALWHRLTRAEQEVALLAARGMTNAAIASRRGSSRKTVDSQIAAVLQKLSIGSRADIREFVPKESRPRNSHQT
ncbi:ATP-binding protein [Nocardia sp. NPDC052566]|uniref:ATP-binding protein n=1 Tax=Nocardia sp. NPDC052566 TaxID=3364330 RepID=UPI0037C5F5C1